MKNITTLLAITFFSSSIFAITDYTSGDDTTRIKTKNKTYLIIDGEDVSAKIVSNNLGVVYDRNNKPDWCS